MTERNNNNCSGFTEIDLQVSAKQEVNISGALTTCENSEEIYSTSTSSDLQNTWYVTNGTIIGASNASTCKVKWNKSGTIKLVQRNTTYNTKDSLTMQVTVNSLPNVALSIQADICLNAGDLVLNGGTPAGGTYSGTGVVGNSFSPALAGVGTFKVYYSFTNTNGCSANDSANITVKSVPAKPTITQSNNELVSSSTSGNQWYLNGNAISGASAQRYTPTVTGQYQVEVTIAGCTSEKSEPQQMNIDPTKLLADFSVDKTSGEAPLVVSFTNKSTSKAQTWLYSFGDGNTSTEANPTHTYTKSGKYTVKLLVTNGSEKDSIVKAELITVSDASPLSADFIADNTEGEAPMTVNFTDKSTGSPTTWNWDFGDGSTSNLQNPTHIYTKVGTYNVQLIVSDGKTIQSKAKNNYIKVNEVLPLSADFTSDVQSGKKPLTVQFSDRSTGKPTIWNWEFGDGATSNEKNPKHTYQTSGKYSVKLSVSDGQNIKSTTKQDYIVVRDEDVSYFATIFIEDFSGETGKTVPLKIQIKDANLPSSISNFKIKLRFNGNILYPEGTEKGTMSGNDRTIELTVPLVTNNGVLAEFPMLAMLGNAESTEIVIESISSEGDLIDFRKEKNPIFTITNISKEGGIRLITKRTASIVKVEVFPNPTTQNATLVVDCEQPANAEISVTNIYGNEVVASISKSLSKGKNQILLDIEALPTGSYFITIKSDEYYSTQKINIIK